MCLSCLDSFLSFCHSVPLHNLKDRVWGILVLANRDQVPDKTKLVEIAEKKLRGFIRANSIKFPIIIDYDQVFDTLAVQGTAIVIMDTGRQIIEKFTFPIKRGDAQKIREFLGKN